MVEAHNWNPIASAYDRYMLYQHAAACGEAKSRVHYRAIEKFGIKSIAQLTTNQCRELNLFYINKMPARRRPQRWNLAEMPRSLAEVSKLGYVRWPRCLAEADMPAAWKAIHLKLMLLLAHKLDLDNPWGRHSLRWKKAREFLGGGRKIDIQSALDQLMCGWITTATPVDMLHGGGGDETYTVLERGSSGVWGQEMFWTLERQFVSDIVDCHDGYGRVQLEVVRNLESFAALRLYLWAQMTKDARRKPGDEPWEPDRLAVFLGCDPEIRMDHLKSRVIEPALAEINAAANFSLHPEYVREPNTHGRAIKTVLFSIRPAQVVKVAA